MITFSTRKRASSLALAIALATGSVVAGAAFAPTPAMAQDEEDGGGYGDAFVAAYVPLDEALKAEGTDVSALLPQLRALVPLLVTNDEKIAGGGLLYNAGIAAQDRPLQLAGMEAIIGSRQVPAEQLGRYNFIAYQLANQLSEYSKSRSYLQAAIDNNFATDQISPSQLQIAMAESFFEENRLNEGYDFLFGAINARKAAGQPVDEQWYRRGLTVAYENQSVPQVYDFVTMWLSDYPNTTNWRDAVNITRNLNEFEAGEILDLFRLSRQVGALQDQSDFDYYVESADPRRLPREVKDVIELGQSTGVVTSDNLFLQESLQIANSRIAADRADLPALERDASAASAGVRTLSAAGDAFLSYGEFAKAAGFYERTLTMPGVDLGEEATRLGITRIGMGDYAGAREALGMVQGRRASIAKLWIAYANEREAAAADTLQPAAPATAGPAAASSAS